MDTKEFIIWIEGACAALCLGFLIGWIFPVEGPYDYLYDKYASQPAHKFAPKQKHQVTIDVNDLSEEDFEALMEIFVNRR